MFNCFRRSLIGLILFFGIVLGGILVFEGCELVLLIIVVVVFVDGMSLDFVLVIVGFDVFVVGFFGVGILEFFIILSVGVFMFGVWLRSFVGKVVILR